jgi:hypothetical protein
MVVFVLYAFQKVNDCLLLFFCSFHVIVCFFPVFHVDSQYLFVGSEDGTLSIATDPAMRLKLLNSSLQRSPYLA